MSRSVWKGPFIAPKLEQKIINAAANPTPGLVIKTMSRSSTIIPLALGLRFGVHNGKTFVPVIVSDDMIGHKLGEFSPTRKFGGHAGTKNTKGTHAKGAMKNKKTTGTKKK